MVKKVKLRTRIVWRKNRRIRKYTYKIPKGIIHIQAGFKNTIITVTDERDRVIYWSSAGTCGFKSKRKRTPFAAQTIATDTSRIAMGQGMRRVKVLIKGAGPGRDAALKAIRKSGIKINFIRDVTPMPHNGCRPPKKKRL
uniref:Small ribosomal subunit protein uS11c n=2 Tax=Passiflora TaxID=3684 RepID=A0A7H0TZ91_9ROSI|nr:ribosomal protein S11 [Passiflora haematostigma]YP_010007500.1 ribosomal protein S11 [Passiflora rhamnifolia]QNR05806.1 ribosomal protein S11 [Passiflora haematostigma]QNR06343.1 ribosomal protein S11 [Passiflora rhamnifolia]